MNDVTEQTIVLNERFNWKMVQMENEWKFLATKNTNYPISNCRDTFSLYILHLGDIQHLHSNILMFLFTPVDIETFHDIYYVFCSASCKKIKNMFMKLCLLPDTMYKRSSENEEKVYLCLILIFLTETISRTDDEGQPRPKYIFNKIWN